MPIYEYRCGNCGEQVEVWLRSQGETPHCPHCGSPLLTKLFSTPYVVSGRTQHQAGKTCCGQEERCETPPCSGNGVCHRR